MASPAARLCAEIDVVLQRMEQARDRSDRLTEEDTKAAFIDPILSPLGWNLHDVYSVSREYRHKRKDNPVDYPLFVARSPVFFVEDKSRNKELPLQEFFSSLPRLHMQPLHTSPNAAVTIRIKKSLDPANNTLFQLPDS